MYGEKSKKILIHDHSVLSFVHLDIARNTLDWYWQKTEIFYHHFSDIIIDCHIIKDYLKFSIDKAQYIVLEMYWKQARKYWYDDHSLLSNKSSYEMWIDASVGLVNVYTVPSLR